jgi:thiol-disulfide isomerase/thioredoxin
MNKKKLINRVRIPIWVCGFIFGGCLAVEPVIQDFKELKLGEEAPVFNLKGTDNQFHSLAEYQDGSVLVVAFISNHCPTSIAVIPRMLEWYKKVKSRGVKLVAINPNHPLGLRPDEYGYSEFDETFEHNQLFEKKYQFTFDYLYDGDQQKAAKEYGCLATPHFFVFNKDKKLVYKGRFDDSRFLDVNTIKSKDLEKAVDEVLTDKKVTVAETRPLGCSTKWQEKQVSVKEDDIFWDKQPVVLESISAEKVKKLRENKTKKYRLINVWASYCGPCVHEFPELVKTARKFALRNFELVTISLDDIKDTESVKIFLEKQNVIVPKKILPSLKEEKRNGNAYIYSSVSIDALASVLDLSWDGSVPFTILIEPGGKILFRQEGEVNGEELRQKILDVMGRTFDE